MVHPMLRGIGGFVLQLPVTTREANDLGRAIFGLPKYVADMDFVESVGRRSVTVSEGGEDVLRLEVDPGGPVIADKGAYVAYSVLDGRLIETAIRAQGHGQARLGRRSGRLHLGTHTAAEQLRRLSIRPEAQRVFSHLDLRLALPWGEPIGRARAVPGYRNDVADRGRLTVAFPGTGPIDQYVIPAGCWSPSSVGAG